MESCVFSVVISGVTVDDNFLASLKEAGCEDAAPVVGDIETRLDFVREAETFREGLRSALDDLHKVRHLKVVRLEPGVYVGVRDIAVFARRTRESVRLLVNGDRGPGDFPSPTYSRQKAFGGDTRCCAGSISTTRPRCQPRS